MRETLWERENESVAWTECRSSKFIDSTKPNILEICVSSYNGIAAVLCMTLL